MLKKILAVLAMLYAAASFAAVDVNKASAADLDGIKGIGPTMTKRIMDERKKSPFKSWDDLITRVKGVGEGNAAVYSKDGLTVNGDAFKGAAATKKEEKKADKQDKKDEKAAAKDAKKDAKADAKKADDKVAAAKPAASAAKPAASSAKK
jgi:competence protein ComEA